MLRLSIDQTSGAFLRLCREVSLTEKVTPRQRSAKLIAAVKALLQEHEVSVEVRLRGSLDGGENCRVYVLALLKV